MTLVLLFSTAVEAEDFWKVTFGDRYGNFGSKAEHAVASPDGRLVAISCRDRSIRLWDITTGKELRRLVGHEAVPKDFVFSPDGTRLLSSEVSEIPRGAFRVWSVATGEQLYVDKQATQSSGAVAWHPSGKYFVTSLEIKESSGRHLGYATDAWDSETFQRTRRILTGTHLPRRLMFSKDGNRLLLSDGGGWPAVLVEIPSGASRRLPQSLTRVVLSTTGTLIAGRQRDGSVVILDADRLTEIRQIKPPLDEPQIGKRFQPSGFNQAFFHPDGQSIFAATFGAWTRWDLAQGKLTQWQICGGNTNSFMMLTADGRHMLQGSGEQQIVLCRLADRRMLARFQLQAADGHWAMDTPEGYFLHSEQLSPVLSNAIHREERAAFVKKHRSEVMVARLLSGLSKEEAERLPEFGTPPTVSIQLVAVWQDAVTVEVVAKSETAGSGIRKVSVMLDGRQIPTAITKGLTVEPLDSSIAASAPESVPAQRTIRTMVSFPAGRNIAQLQAIAWDDYGQRSAVASVTAERPIKVPPVTGRLFVLAVGVSQYDNPQFNLRYSHADAIELSEKFLQQKGRAFGDVQVQVYTDQKATVTNLKEGLAWLQRSCTASDVAIVLFSGHGVQRERGLYYVTHEANLEGLQYTCLNWETVAESLHQTQARQVLFLSDACFAGAFGQAKLAPQDELANKLRDAAGVMFFTSSQAGEPSMEDDRWQHGAFCKALLDALDGQADTNGDGKITIGELQNIVSKQVVEMTNGKQHPTIPDLGRFDPDLVIAHCWP